MPKVSSTLWRGRLSSPMHAAVQADPSTLRGGRLSSPMHAAVQVYLSSFAEDCAAADTDVDTGEAHALALRRAGILSAPELRRVLRGYERARAWCARPGAGGPAPPRGGP